MDESQRRDWRAESTDTRLQRTLKSSLRHLAFEQHDFELRGSRPERHERLAAPHAQNERHPVQCRKGRHRVMRHRPGQRWRDLRLQRSAGRCRQCRRGPDQFVSRLSLGQRRQQHGADAGVFRRPDRRHRGDALG